MDNVKLLVIDSLAAVIRRDFDSEALSERQVCTYHLAALISQSLLSKIAAVLKYYADSFQLSIVVVNQVTTKVFSLVCQFLMRLAWSSSLFYPCLGNALVSLHKYPTRAGILRRFA